MVEASFMTDFSMEEMYHFYGKRKVLDLLKTFTLELQKEYLSNRLMYQINKGSQVIYLSISGRLYVLDTMRKTLGRCEQKVDPYNNNFCKLVLEKRKANVGETVVVLAPDAPWESIEVNSIRTCETIYNEYSITFAEPVGFDDNDMVDHEDYAVVTGEFKPVEVTRILNTEYHGRQKEVAKYEKYCPPYLGSTVHLDIEFYSGAYVVTNVVETDKGFEIEYHYPVGLDET